MCLCVGAQDTVTPVTGRRQAATAAAVLLALLVLVPMAPELAESVGVGPETNLLL